MRGTDKDFGDLAGHFGLLIFGPVPAVMGQGATSPKRGRNNSDTKGFASELAHG